MIVLVTGAAGMLGTDILAAVPDPNIEVVGADLHEAPVHLDITKPSSVAETFERLHPDVVIHCAAFTNVDKAEADAISAYRVNALGSWSVATACSRVGAALCYISTDFVFDGQTSAPYHEFNLPHPLNVYGASKLAGEREVAEWCQRSWIVRTAWLYGIAGKSFVRTILEKGAAGQPLHVVADQFGSPTYTSDLARAIWQVVLQAPCGVYHRVNSGVASWYELACAALSLAHLDERLVTPIASSEWPSPATRPPYSALRSMTAEAVGLPPLRPWHDALVDFVTELHKTRAPKASV